jgi:hypothetical protein
MVRIRIPRRALELQFKGKRPMVRPKARWFTQLLEDIKKREKSRQEIEKDTLWEDRRDWRFFVHRLV